jgi:hypothetical protein
MFRRPIESAIRKDMSKGGKPPYDAILMYKTTMLQQVRVLPHVEHGQWVSADINTDQARVCGEIDAQHGFPEVARTKTLAKRLLRIEKIVIEDVRFELAGEEEVLVVRARPTSREVNR